VYYDSGYRYTICVRVSKGELGTQGREDAHMDATQLCYNSLFGILLCLDKDCAWKYFGGMMSTLQFVVIIKRTRAYTDCAFNRTHGVFRAEFKNIHTCRVETMNTWVGEAPAM
jgi:hypothetical protein